MSIPYCGTPPVPGAVNWNLDPVLISLLLAAAGGYWLTSRRTNCPADRQSCFYGGWALLAFCLVAPLCNLSVALFSARVGQHMMIEFMAAPLIAIGLPLRLTVFERPEGSLRHALLGALPFAMALWFWHLPTPYTWTFESTAAYWSMHVTLFLSAVLLWRVLLDQRRPAASLIASGITTAQMTILGAVYTFATRAFFEVHFGTTSVWGMSPLDDQQLGGLIMWIPPGLALAAMATWSMAVLLREKPDALPHRA